jgi:hypothetical protein
MRPRVSRPALTSIVLFGGGCVAPIDILGQEQVVKQQDHLQGTDLLADDRIEDKHPVFDPTLTVDEQFDGCSVTLNKRGSVTKLDVIPFPDADGALGKTPILVGNLA